MKENRIRIEITTKKVHLPGSMAGIYLHIPFCRQACAYCNFHFSTSLASKNEIIGSLLKEIDLRKEYLDGAEIDTIYFGGGTPSLLSIREIDDLLNAIHRFHRVSTNVEVTLEGNPDDLNSTILKQLLHSGVNRLSIGIQSLFDEDLQWMHRAHNRQQAFACIHQAFLAGFKNLSADLIFGYHLLTASKWEQNIDQFLAWEIPHISCYGITVENKTLLSHQINKGLTPEPDQAILAEQYNYLIGRLTESGYRHYEISNFAKPGFESRHNSSYWHGVHYLGIGPSAHSFNGTSRQWNCSNNALYHRTLQNNALPAEIEILRQMDILNERIMTEFRLDEGIKLSSILDHLKSELIPATWVQIEKWKSEGMLLQQGDRLYLTQFGKLFADGIAADFFISEDDLNS